jgi:Gram-negative bacterial TonB protein C-terminal
MVLPLRVWTHHSPEDNSPAQWAHTIETSNGGCRLAGLRTELPPGETITLQRGKQKAYFRVVWSRQLAPNEFQSGIEALDSEKNIWLVEATASPAMARNDLDPAPSSDPQKSPVVKSPIVQTQTKKSAAKRQPRLRWSFGLLFLAITLGVPAYYALFYASGSAAIQPPQPAVPTAAELARFTPKPRPTSALTKIWDPSAPRLQVAESPTGRIVYPQPPDNSISGKVSLQIVIAANGLVKQIHALSGNPSLAEAAAQAIRLWRYTPFQEQSQGIKQATQSSQPTDRETTVTVSFLGPDAVFLEFPAQPTKN